MKASYLSHSFSAVCHISSQTSLRTGLVCSLVAPGIIADFLSRQATPRLFGQMSLGCSDDGMLGVSLTCPTSNLHSPPLLLRSVPLVSSVEAECHFRAATPQQPLQVICIRYNAKIHLTLAIEGSGFSSFSSLANMGLAILHLHPIKALGGLAVYCNFASRFLLCSSHLGSPLLASKIM